MQRHLSQEHRDAAPAFAGQPLPNRRRQIAHRGIRANAPTRTALETRFSVIRRAPSNYERQCQWDIENIFDELKNQWGWGGFVTHDLARCRLAARLVALFYDWWNIFVRLAEPDWHREAITSRPLLLHAIAERVRHARQTTIKIASTHARSVPAAEALRAVAVFLRGLVRSAEQLTDLQRWREILAKAFKAFLNGRPLRVPPRLKPG
jgi:hypothetical protein